MPTASLTGVQVDILVPVEPAAPTVVRLRGELDIAQVDTVDADLAPVVAGAEHDVVIDLEELQFIDVSGVNLLVRAAAGLHAADRALCLRAPSPILVKVLQVAGLEEHLPVLASGEA